MAATVVSICPFEINETKPGIVPGHFHIDKVNEGDIKLLVVNGASFKVSMPMTNIVHTLQETPEALAASIVNDRLTGQMLYKPDCKPGLFWVPGEQTVDSIRKNHAKELKEAIEFQHNWFIALVKQADTDWEVTKNHHSISDTQRHAAKVLRMESKPWLVNDKPLNATKDCIACFSQIDARATICKVCGTSQVSDMKMAAAKDK
jgi:hypothetical protein